MKGKKQTKEFKPKKKRIGKTPILPSMIKNRDRRKKMVVLQKISKSKEDVLYKMEKRKMEKAGVEFEQFKTITQEDKAISAFLPKKQLQTQLEEGKDKEILEKTEDIADDDADDDCELVDLDEDLRKELENDEFKSILSGEKKPKVFLTTMFRTPTRKSYLLLQGKPITNKKSKT
jgi:hypothetical protein